MSDRGAAADDAMLAKQLGAASTETSENGGCGLRSRVSRLRTR